MCQKRSPPTLGPGLIGPLWLGPQSPNPGGPSWSSPKLRASKQQWACWAGRALTRPLVSKSPGGGVPSGSLLPESPHLSTTAPSQGSLGRTWDFSGVQGKGKKALDTSPGTFHSLLQPSKRTLSGAPVPKEPKWGMKRAAALWTFPVTTT